MKKFFSLVLALVMALSLTTVAWGADALQSAIAAGETDIVLPAGNYNLPTTTGDVTISGTTDAVITINKPTANTITLKGVTVVGSGHYTGIQHSTKVVYEDCVINGLQFLYADTVVFKNCKLNANGAEHCVWTYGADNVSFTNCEFTYTDRAVNAYSDQGPQSNTVSFDNCTFIKNGTTTSAGAIEINSSIMTSVDLSVDEDTTANQGELWWVSGWDSNYGRDTTVKENGVEYAAAEVNGVKYITLGAAIQAADPGDTITLLDDIKLVDGQGGNPSALTVDKDVTIDLAGHDIASAAGSSAGIKATADLTIEDSVGGSSVSIPLAEDTANGGDITITGGSYTDDVSEYVADGYRLVSGTVASVPTNTTGVVGGYEGMFTFAGATRQAVTNLTKTPAVAPLDADEDGYYNRVGDRLGSIEYYTLNLGGAVAQNYYKVNTVDDADLIIYVGDSKTPYMYLANEPAGGFTYLTGAAAFNNFGKACGQFKWAAVDTTKTYYAYDGKVYMADPAGAVNLMIGTSFIQATDVTANGSWVAHVPVYTQDKTGAVTAVKCAHCPASAVIVANYAALPNTVKAAGTYFNVPGSASKMFYWVDGTVVVPSTDKVQSAETFDAGIAMYVGMSVMAAAGSAVVVLKKRED